MLSSLSALEVTVNARSAVLMDAESGQVLFEKRGHEALYPASISKVATALYVLERGGDRLSEVATASREAVGAVSTADKRKSGYTLPAYRIEHGSSHIGIKEGEKLPMEALLYGLMLQSANDAANVLAEHVCGSIPQFLDGLNARVRELGCKNTHFRNPHGLHHPDHVSSAYDMALITREALKHPTFRKVVSTLNYERPETNLQPSAPLPQKNRLVKPGQYYYPKAIGVKTGFTQDAKGTLIAAAVDGDRTLIAVVMGCYPFAETYRDVTALFTAAFAEQKREEIVVEAGKRFSRKIPHAKGRLVAHTSDNLIIDHYPSSKIHYTQSVQWLPVTLPVGAGEKVGRVVLLSSSGNVIREVALIASKPTTSSFFLKVASWPKFAKLGLVAVVVGLSIWLARRVRRIARG